MSKMFIEDTSLTAIADAIRAKTGDTSKLSPAQMVTAIDSISTGGGSGIVWGFQNPPNDSDGYTTFAQWGADAIQITASKVVSSPQSCTYDLSNYIDDTTPFIFGTATDYGSATSSASYYQLWIFGNMLEAADGTKLLAYNVNNKSRVSAGSNNKTMGTDAMSLVISMNRAAKGDISNTGTQQHFSFKDGIMTFQKWSNSGASNRQPTGNYGYLWLPKEG